MTREGSGSESEVPDESRMAGESRSDERTDIDPVDWSALERTRRAYRVLFLLCHALYAADRIPGFPGSGAGWADLTVLTVASLLVFAAFLYYFLRTARLLGYSGLDRFGMGLLTVVPLVYLFAVVIWDLRMGAMISRRERATAAGGEAVTRARVPLVPRLLVSLLVAFLVLLISVGAGFILYLESPIQYSQTFTLRDIGRLQAAIEAYGEETGALPRTLRDVAAWSQEDESWNLRVDGSGAPVDAWKRRLHYSTDGMTYRITSYGYDGKPGGTGLYYDLSSDDLGEEDSSEGGKRTPPVPVEAGATFKQFVTDTGLINSVAEPMHGSGLMVVLTCLLASAVTFMVVFLDLGRRDPLTRGRLRPLVISLFALVVAAAYAAITIAGFHLPSGH